MPMHLCALCGEAAVHQEDGALLNLPVYTESLNHEGGGNAALVFQYQKYIANAFKEELYLNYYCLREHTCWEK